MRKLARICFDHADLLSTRSFCVSRTDPSMSAIFLSDVLRRGDHRTRPGARSGFDVIARIVSSSNLDRLRRLTTDGDQLSTERLQVLFRKKQEVGDSRRMAERVVRLRKFDICLQSARNCREMRPINNVWLIGNTSRLNAYIDRHNLDE
jgi:hypothetical protein